MIFVFDLKNKLRLLERLTQPSSLSGLFLPSLCAVQNVVIAEQKLSTWNRLRTHYLLAVIAINSFSPSNARSVVSRASRRGLANHSTSLFNIHIRSANQRPARGRDGRQAPPRSASALIAWCDSAH